MDTWTRSSNVDNLLIEGAVLPSPDPGGFAGKSTSGMPQMLWQSKSSFVYQ
jgi:hypothetical protein